MKQQALNMVTKEILRKTNIRSALEPIDAFRDDDKRFDGMGRRTWSKENIFMKSLFRSR